MPRSHQRHSFSSARWAQNLPSATSFRMILSMVSVEYPPIHYPVRAAAGNAQARASVG
jgi:hypothetical protein